MSESRKSNFFFEIPNGSLGWTYHQPNKQVRWRHPKLMDGSSYRYLQTKHTLVIEDSVWFCDVFFEILINACKEIINWMAVSSTSYY
jgi:hypothetical protein